MNLIRIDLLENRLGKLIGKLNKKSWNPTFIILMGVLIAVPATGYVAGKKFAKSKGEKVSVIKIAEFKEKPPQSEENYTIPSKEEPPEEEHTKKITITTQIKRKPKLIRVTIESPKLDIFKSICIKTEEQTEKEKITLTRIIALKTPDCSLAKSVVEKLKKQAPFLDPWIKHKKKSCLVVAGSYSKKENVVDAINYLKKHGYHPTTERLYLTKEAKKTVCYVTEDKLKKLETLLIKQGLKFNYTPGDNDTRRNTG